jgi:hypothetical protein
MVIGNGIRSAVLHWQARLPHESVSDRSITSVQAESATKTHVEGISTFVAEYDGQHTDPPDGSGMRM